MSNMGECSPLPETLFLLKNKSIPSTFQSSVAFHIEISQWILQTNQMTGFYMKSNTRLKWVKNNKVTLALVC